MRWVERLVGRGWSKPKSMASQLAQRKSSKSLSTDRER